MNQIPLAERMRPKDLNTFIGQQHLVGDGQVLKNMITHKQLSSLIFWGPPGVGKTTLAHILAADVGLPIFTLSAIESGVKDIRSVIDRFNKSQQDSLLGAVEKGIVTLIGATTENPSFEVIAPLLSRCQVYVLQPLSEAELLALMQQSLTQDEWLKNYEIKISEHEALLQMSGGDARKLLNLLELVVQSLGEKNKKIEITNDVVMKILQRKMALYDKNGEQRYHFCIHQKHERQRPQCCGVLFGTNDRGWRRPQIYCSAHVNFSQRRYWQCQPNCEGDCQQLFSGGGCNWLS